MEGLPEGEYHFSASRKIGVVLVILIMASIPFTLQVINQRQPSEQYSAAKCIVRPSCLDNSPTCALPEPIDGWCPPSGAPQRTTQPNIPASFTPTPSITATGDTCAMCQQHAQHYLCTNQRTNKRFCFAVMISAPDYSCMTCPTTK